jgi:hypothetical protein
VTPLRALSCTSLLAASLGLGCLTWKPLARDQSLPSPERVVASQAAQLFPGTVSEGGLDCKAGRCDQWFRVRADQVGVLRAEARIEGLAERAVARLSLQSGSGTLAQAVSSDGLPLRVESAVEPGLYAVLVQAGGGPVRYAVETALEHASTPPLQPGSSDSPHRYPMLDRATGRLVHPQPGECLAKVEAREYFYEVKRAIFQQWELPAGVAPDQTVNLRLRIAESGELLDATLAAGADSRLAASALEAVRRAAPFPRMSSEARCLDGTEVDASFRNPGGR